MVEHKFENWADFYSATIEITEQFRKHWSSPKSAVAFFRGHSAITYNLLPGIFRVTTDNERYFSKYDEANFFYEFKGRAGELLQQGVDSWEILFAMQHFGVPTRLLDWSESFASALYFALFNKHGLEINTNGIDIWILDPYELNGHFWKEDIVDVYDDLQVSYVECVLERKKTFCWQQGALAIYPVRRNARIIAQQGVFTIHNSSTPVEKMNLDRLHRFSLCGEVAIKDARKFLLMAGVNSFTIKPDLVGLSEYLNHRFSPQNPNNQNLIVSCEESNFNGL